MKRFLEELMNQLYYFITPSIDRFDGLEKSDESIFLFLDFFLETSLFFS